MELVAAVGRAEENGGTQIYFMVMVYRLDRAYYYKKN